MVFDLPNVTDVPDSWHHVTSMEDQKKDSRRMAKYTGFDLPNVTDVSDSWGHVTSIKTSNNTQRFSNL